MKKVLSLFLAFVMLFSLGTTVFAENTTSQEPVINLDIVTSDLAYSVIDAEKYNTLEIGNHMMAYVWNGTDLVSSEDEVLFYPIYGDGEIVAILTMFNPNHDQSYSVAIDFAKELNSATAQGSQKYFIVEAGSKIYIHTNGQTSLLKENGKPMDIPQSQAQTADSIAQGGLQPDGGPVVTDGSTNNYEASDALTLSELASYISDNADALPNTLHSDETVKEERIDITQEHQPPMSQREKLVTISLWGAGDEKITCALFFPK